MDAKFYPAIAAIKAGDVEKFKALVAADPSLATSRSSVSHPTLLQCLVLDGENKPNAREMAEVLIEAGADVNEPLVAAGSIDHRRVANGHGAMVEFLLQHGADRNVKDTKVGSTAAGWAEYGGHKDLLDLLR